MRSPDPRQAPAAWREPRQTAVLALIAAVATVVLVAAGGQEATRGDAAPPRASWEGLAGGARPKVAVGQRMIVVLEDPSLAELVGRSGRVTDRQQRKWTRGIRAKQSLLISRLGVQGIRIRTEFRFQRVLNGFSAALDARALSLLEKAPEVAGIYPVRTAYPASVSSRILADAAFGAGTGHRHDLAVPGFDGRGVTIALLDTGVDSAQPFLRGRVLNGIDIVGGQTYALAAPKPDSPAELERHGTEMAGLLVGAGGPGSLSGVATGAFVLPIRVAGWQRDATGAWAVYARTDQLVAGLESAVDPNGDGDAHDAARIALVGVAAPYGAFADDPAAQAVAGAVRLDTLVVAPAGNDGASGPGYGSISGPGGARAALTVGAVDLRRTAPQVRVALRVGLELVFDRVVPLGGVVAPGDSLTAELAVPRAGPARPGADASPAAVSLDRFFDRGGLSLVAGRAALVPAGAEPGTTVQNAATAGAAAVVVSGGRLPGGALGVHDDVAIPVVSVPDATVRALEAALERGETVAVSIGSSRVAANPGFGRVAAFSSGGLAFDGGVKPDLVAPGVALMTSEPGRNRDGSPRFGTVNGSSVAAAITAGAAALLAQSRPSLDARALKSVLVTSASPLAGLPVTAQGAGVLDVGAAAAAELAIEPATLAFGRASSARWRARERLRVRNLSSRTVSFRARVDQTGEGAASLALAVRPERVLLRPGQAIRIRVDARATSELSGQALAEGAIALQRRGGLGLRVPWAIAFGPARPNLLGEARLDVGRVLAPGEVPTFQPSDAAPARLTIEAGRLPRSPLGQEVQPLARLDIELWNRAGDRLGLLARLRDVLPGRYAFGITGRGPAGARLPRGSYTLRILALPTGRGTTTRRAIQFRIR